MAVIKTIRTAARAVIIDDGKLLAIKMRDQRGIYYILPGGGQKPGETLADTLRRECLEEVGLDVEIGQLIYVREYIGRNHRFSERHVGFHQLEHVFLCRVADPLAAAPGHETDNHQIGVSWLSLDNLAAIRFYPECIKEFFQAGGIVVPAIYLGDCN
jgi:8-oxo-dGTP diphosphatase